MGEPKHPVSGTDYPGTFQEFDEWFSSENACIDYIAKVRWPDGFICPGCGFKSKNPSLTNVELLLMWSTFLEPLKTGNQVVNYCTLMSQGFKPSQDGFIHFPCTCFDIRWRFDQLNRLAFHFQINDGVTVGCVEARVTQPMADRCQVNARLK